MHAVTPFHSITIQILIPVSGSSKTGTLRAQSVHEEKWKLKSVVLEFEGRPQKLVIVDNSTDTTVTPQSHDL